MDRDASMIMVAGMHRSGTSLLMRLLDQAGLSTGTPDDLIAPASSNESGHWELIAVARLNDDVLAAAGSHWSAPTNDDEEPLIALAQGELGERARRLIDEELDGVEVVKDPRFCLTLPFWRAVFDDDVALLVPWRHPLEVAGSLEARNSFPRGYGHWLWTEYHRQLHLHGRGIPRLVVEHRTLLVDPSEQVAGIVRFVTPFLATERRLATIDGAGVEPSALNHRADTKLDAGDSALLQALVADAAFSPVETPSGDRRVAFGAVAVTANDRDQIRWRLHASRAARRQL